MPHDSRAPGPDAQCQHPPCRHRTGLNDRSRCLRRAQLPADPQRAEAPTASMRFPASTNTSRTLFPDRACASLAADTAVTPISARFSAFSAGAPAGTAVGQCRYDRALSAGACRREPAQRSIRYAEHRM
jgi:hypothetical protein